jgi:hypothetical protein
MKKIKSHPTNLLPEITNAMLTAFALEFILPSIPSPEIFSTEDLERLTNWDSEIPPTIGYCPDDEFAWIQQSPEPETEDYIFSHTIQTPNGITVHCYNTDC